MEIENVSDEKLVDEWEIYEQLVHGNSCCFGVRDVLYLYAIENELIRRNKTFKRSVE